MNREAFREFQELVCLHWGLVPESKQNKMFLSHFRRLLKQDGEHDDIVFFIGLLNPPEFISGIRHSVARSAPGSL